MNSLQVTTINGRGRAYCATTSIAKGSIVLTSSPFAAIISQEWLPETCLWCFHCSYPRRNKVRAVQHQDTKRRKTPFEVAGFCSEECKEHVTTSYHQDEWQSTIEAYMAIDNEYRTREQHEGIATPAISDVDSKEDYFGASLPVDRDHLDGATDINDDVQLQEWINRFWDLAVVDPSFNASVKTFLPDADKVDMSKLISTCLIRKHYSQIYKGNDTSMQSFDNLMLMQCNEVTRFRDLYRKTNNSRASDNFNNVIPSSALSNFDIAVQYVPEDILRDVQLYLFFSASFDNGNTIIPWSYNHQLFRHVFYREMSNSFGIWDPPEGCEQELLGWALHPQAVFFNHSCAPNIRKLRQGRDMVFMAEQDIQEGDELCISYGSTEEPVESRRKRLLENYSFWCQCTRCIAESP